MTFIIQRKYLTGLANWLASLSLQGAQSRSRTKFVKLAADALNRADKERLELIEEYGEKDEDGNLKKVTDEKTKQESYVIPDDKLKEFTDEVNKIFELDAEISAPEISTTLVTIRNLVLNTEEKIGPEIAVQYDYWCEAFEKLQLN